ncbi:hypothetical protein QWJ34_26885 [Saccharibacillus sp. CPCC 101409]|uniref:hypothetical protein n=1 Tax=Saccharibacillus sp. CPCC 101409 TaxID=3058041 RepID=UPI0026731157|nr:hypothetical protein [Saccharibacillus sp. CPCC 101409]MDO3413404.1 hypothetical protein [Saccharibacillus sp. CPCC 101409]
MYSFDTTEKNNATANDYETKSMLYLMGMRDDSPTIDMFIIDCFNDVTGACENVDELWDVQSKGVKSLNPKKIGIALATLFLNYKSSVPFNFYIFFMPKLKEGYLIDESLKVFEYSNILISKKNKVVQGLEEEYIRRKNNSYSNLNNDINKFLDEVLFVIAEDENIQYVKNLVEFKRKDQWSDEFYLSLFNEIRDMQSSIKNICIDGESIKDKKEILRFNKILRRKNLESLIINRLVSMDVFNNKTIPINFFSEIKNLEDEEEVQDIILDCQIQISETLFNKNLKLEFWQYFEYVIEAVKTNPSKTPRQIHEEIPIQITEKIFTLNEIASIYFISMIKGGLF